MHYEKPEGVSVHSGFPNPATDADLQGIDLNRLLIQNSAATYMMRVAGNEWNDIGIFHADLLVIDRAVAIRPADLVIWWHNDTFAVSPRRRLPRNGEVWGVVTAVIHQYRGRDE